MRKQQDRRSQTHTRHTTRLQPSADGSAPPRLLDHHDQRGVHEVPEVEAASSGPADSQSRRSGRGALLRFIPKPLFV